MILISDNKHHIIKDPKHIEIVEIDDLGYLIKADGVILGYSRSHDGAMYEMARILTAMEDKITYQVCSYLE